MGSSLVATPAGVVGLDASSADFRPLQESFSALDDVPALVSAGDLLQDAMTSSGVLFSGPVSNDGNADGDGDADGDADAVSASNNLVELGKQLLASARDGDTDEVRRLIARGAPFTTDWLGTSPLHMSAQYGHADTCSRLLSAGISKDARTKVEKTPLHVAATEGHLDVMEVLLKARCDVNSVDLLRMTPLHWAVDRGHVAAVELLLRHWASVEVASKFDKTPLEIASDKGRSEIFEILQNPEPYRLPLDTEESDAMTLAATNSITVHENSDIKKIIQQEIGSPTSSGASTGSGESKAEAMKLLEAHGITLLPEESSSEAPLANLMRSGGQQLALTEAGKLALSGTAKVTTRQPIVVTKPISGGAKKVITLDKSGVRKIVTTPVGSVANVVSGLTGISPSGMAAATGGKGPVTRRITVSPAQLARLKELQKSGGTIQMKRVVIGANGQKRTVVGRPISTTSVVGRPISGASIPGLGGRTITSPTSSFSASSSSSPTSPSKTRTVKIIRVDQSTGNQTVSNLVVPVGATVVPSSAGASPTINVVRPKATVATTAATSSSTPIILKSEKTEEGAGSKELEKTRRELEQFKKEMEEKNREIERLKQQLAGTTSARKTQTGISSDEVD